MQTKISSVKYKIENRPTRFYSPKLKKEILEICGELHDLGWSRKRIQSALGVGYQSTTQFKNYDKERLALVATLQECELKKRAAENAKLSN